MKVYFDKCSQAIERANITNTYGLFYSEDLTADTNIHVHECCEVLFCLSGGKNFLINDRIYEVNDGDVFIINQFEPHKITFDRNKVFSRFVLQVHPAFLFSSSTEQTDLSKCFFLRTENISHKITLSDEELKEFQQNFMNLKTDYEYGDDIIKNSIILEILVRLNQIFNERCKETKYLPSDNNLLVLKSVSYINSHLSDDLTLEKIAKNSYISVNKLGKLFKTHLGTTVTKYIISRRITEAKKLLKNGKTVSETAELCGFGDYANFIRSFKKSVGVSPGKYAIHN